MGQGGGLTREPAPSGKGVSLSFAGIRPSPAALLEEACREHQRWGSDRGSWVRFSSLVTQEGRQKGGMDPAGLNICGSKHPGAEQTRGDFAICSWEASVLAMAPARGREETRAGRKPAQCRRGCGSKFPLRESPPLTHHFRGITW